MRLDLKRLFTTLLVGFCAFQPLNGFSQTLFCATGANGVDGQLFTVDPGTATATLIGNITDANGPISLTGLAFDPATGVLYGVTGGLSQNGSDIRSLVLIDTNTAN